jgi:hypothetical protein
MPLTAVRHVRKMRGGAQAHLLEADDGKWYVVKFRNNPQHRRDLIVTKSFQDRLELEKSFELEKSVALTSGTQPAPLACCFPFPPTYAVRGGSQWIVNGSFRRKLLFSSFTIGIKMSAKTPSRPASRPVAVGKSRRKSAISGGGPGKQGRAMPYRELDASSCRNVKCWRLT